MGLRKYLPDEQLSGSIEYFFTLELKRNKISVERILPAVSDTFILNYGSPLYGQNGDEFFEFPKCFIHKTDKESRNIKFNHQVIMAGAVFKAGMISTFTNVAFANSSEFLINPVLIFGKEINWLFEVTKEIKSLSDRIKIIEQFFIKKHQETRPGLNLLKKAIQKIISSHGRESVSNVSAGTNLNDRYLRKLFSTYVGISPKRFCEIIRIRKALTLIIHEKYSISEAAFFLEYYDLAHFSHSFKRIIGTSPKRYFSEQNELNHLFLTSNMDQEEKMENDIKVWLIELLRSN